MVNFTNIFFYRSTSVFGLHNFDSITLYYVNASVVGKFETIFVYIRIFWPFYDQMTIVMFEEYFYECPLSFRALAFILRILKSTLLALLTLLTMRGWIRFNRSQVVNFSKFRDWYASPIFMELIIFFSYKSTSAFGLHNLDQIKLYYVNVCQGGQLTLARPVS